MFSKNWVGISKQEWKKIRNHSYQTGVLSDPLCSCGYFKNAWHKCYRLFVPLLVICLLHEDQFVCVLCLEFIKWMCKWHLYLSVFHVWNYLTDLSEIWFWFISVHCNLFFTWSSNQSFFPMNMAHCTPKWYRIWNIHVFKNYNFNLTVVYI